MNYSYARRSRNYRATQSLPEWECTHPCRLCLLATVTQAIPILILACICQVWASFRIQLYRSTTLAPVHFPVVYHSPVDPTVSNLAREVSLLEVDLGVLVSQQCMVALGINKADKVEEGKLGLGLALPSIIVAVHHGCNRKN